MTNNKKKVCSPKTAKATTRVSSRMIPKRGTPSSLFGSPPGQAGLNFSGLPAQKHGNVSTRISGCDVVGDISAFQDFEITEPFRVNPADSVLFPRLSAVAEVFEKYKFHSLEFLYFPISAATRTGAVVFALETDVRDQPFSNKEEMLNHYNSRRTSPWAPMVFPVSRKDLHPRPQMFVRPELTTDFDARLDDVGNLYIGTAVDSESPIAVGELWVRYDIELISPSVHTDLENSNAFILSASAGAGTSPAFLAENASVTGNSTWDDFFSVSGAAGNYIYSYGPTLARAVYQIFNGSASAADWITPNTLSVAHGVARRNFPSNGDITSIKDSNNGWNFLSDVLAFPGIIASYANVLNLSDLAHAYFQPGTLAAGLVNTLWLQLLPAPTGLKATVPPVKVSNLNQHKSSLRRMLRDGRFSHHCKDAVVHLRHQGKTFVCLPGRGQVPESAPLRSLPPPGRSAQPSSPTPSPEGGIPISKECTF